MLGRLSFEESAQHGVLLGLTLDPLAELLADRTRLGDGAGQQQGGIGSSSTWTRIDRTRPVITCQALTRCPG